MLGRNLSNFLVITLGAGALMLGEAIGEADSQRHPGRTLEQGTDQPVVAAIKAWPRSDQTGSDGDCPMYGDAPLDSRISQGDGNFELSIASGQRTYTVVYCASGYYTRVDRDLPNDTDGEAVIPLPVHIRSVASMQSGSAVDFDKQVVRLAVFTLNELSYLRGIDSERFDAALRQYSEVLEGTDSKGAQILGALSNVAADWAK